MNRWSDSILFKGNWDKPKFHFKRHDKKQRAKRIYNQLEIEPCEWNVTLFSEFNGIKTGEYMQM